MHAANPSPNPNHPDHDPILIAGHAARDLVESERARAQSLLDTCRSCTDLHRDLIAITAATRSLPKLATAPRDFRLTSEQAAGLRRTGWLRTILAPFAGAKSAARPMAAAFTTLGVAGLLIATVFSGLGGSAGSLAAPARDQGTTTGAAAPTAAPAPAASALGPGQPAPNATSGVPGDEFGAKDGNIATGTPGAATGAPEVAVNGGAGTDAPRVPEVTTDRPLGTVQPNLLVVGSLALLALGLLLFGLRFAARRLRT